MSDTTIFMAQIIGPTLAAVGLGILFNPGFYQKIFQSFGEPDFDMMLTPMVMIPVGIVMVMKHFLWDSFPAILISVVALAILAKGAFIAILPTAFKGLIRAIPLKALTLFAALIWIAGGSYLSWVGFF